MERELGPLLLRWTEACAKAKFPAVGNVSFTTSKWFGDGEAIFRWGQLLLRFVRDRCEEFIDIAPVSDPNCFLRLDDVGVAFGWRSLEAILLRDTPISLEDELAALAEHGSQVQDAFASQRLKETLLSVDRAAAARVAALKAILRSKSEQGR